MTDKEKLISEIKEILIPHGVEKIILFGSYAYGHPDKHSDIDILVIKNIDKEEVRDFRIKLKMHLWELITRENRPIDILVDSEERIDQRIREGDLFYKEILTKGNVIYA